MFRNLKMFVHITKCYLKCHKFSRLKCYICGMKGNEMLFEIIYIYIYYGFVGVVSMLYRWRHQNSLKTIWSTEQKVKRRFKHEWIKLMQYLHNVVHFFFIVWFLFIIFNFVQIWRFDLCKSIKWSKLYIITEKPFTSKWQKGCRDG